MSTRADGARLVRLEQVSKRFGGVRALVDVDLEVEAGSVHALVGENGAGKSTLGKIIAGRATPDGGRVLVDGRPVHLRRPSDALHLGIAGVAQELAVMPHRSVLENVFLGIQDVTLGVVRGRSTLARYDRLVARTGLELQPNVLAGSLRLADQQKVEILRAVARDARLIVMDEPTAALDRTDTETLLALLRRLAAGGTAVVFVSHFLEEVLQVADTVTLMRDGLIRRTGPADRETTTSLIEGMLGRRLEATFPERAAVPSPRRAVLQVRGLGRGSELTDCSLTVDAGEIVGVAGLVGSGRSELARSIFGADPRTAGEVVLAGRVLPRHDIRAAMDAGMAMLPESRKSQGLQMHRPVLENVTLPRLAEVSTGPVLRRRRESARVSELAERLGIRMATPRDPVSSLSGGNQQKVMFARWLLTPPALLIADEPTRGVDIGAKVAIYGLLAQLASAGTGVLLISSEIEEVRRLAHRVLVMRSGRLVDEIPAELATETRIMTAAFGGVAGTDESRTHG